MMPDARGELRFLVEDEDRRSKSWYYLRGGKFVFSEVLDQNPAVQILGSKAGVEWKLTATEATEIRGGKTTV